MKFKKRNRRRRSALQLIKHWIKPMLLMTLTALIVWGWNQYNPTNLLKVELNWSIDHPELISQATLKQQIKPLVGELHQLDLSNIKQTLEQQPWVLNAQVKRSLLDVIDIHITTHQVATRWQNIDCTTPKATNCQGYITQQGELIKPTNLAYHQPENTKNLIELRSANKVENANSLYADYQAYQAQLKTFTINTFTRSNIDTLHLEPNITVILGYDQQAQRLQKFVDIYAQLRKKISLRKLNKATYDMRYPKGFTLKY